MWTCSKCGRIFGKANQPHSCRRIPLEKHFKNKDTAKKLFNYLVAQITEKVGEVKTISIPCCIHLFGKYDFLAAIPKKDRLEIRIVLNKVPNSQRVTQSVPVSSKNFKICFEIKTKDEIDEELIKWISDAYSFKGIG